MGITYDQLTEILLTSGDYFEVIAPKSFGRQDVYRGKDATAFLTRAAGHRHAHTVLDENGAVIYRRDYNGKVTLDTGSARYLSNDGKRYAGRRAMESNFKGSVRRARKLWNIGF